MGPWVCACSPPGELLQMKGRSTLCHLETPAAVMRGEEGRGWAKLSAEWLMGVFWEHPQQSMPEAWRLGGGFRRLWGRDVCVCTRCACLISCLSVCVRVCVCHWRPVNKQTSKNQYDNKVQDPGVEWHIKVCNNPNPRRDQSHSWSC